MRSKYIQTSRKTPKGAQNTQAKDQGDKIYLQKTKWGSL